MKEIVNDIIEVHKKLVDEFQANSIETVIAASEMITDCLKNDGCVYLCGNGGSAADAQHIAGELVGRFIRDRKALPAVAFTTDTSVITAIANDFSFDEIFSRQTEALVKTGDILWAISTSGNSGNVVAAAEIAKKKNAKVIVFTGKPASKLEQIADICFCVDAPNSYNIQQIHQLAYHMICELVDRRF